MNVIIFTDTNNCYGFGRDAGAYRIASELRLHGYSVQVIDFFAYMELDDIKNIADKFVSSETMMVAFSTSHFVGKEDNEKNLRQSSFENFRDRITITNTIECFPHSKEWMTSLVNIFKKRNSNIKIVVGGEKTVTVNTKNFNDIVDYWVRGIADKSIVELAKNLDNNTFPKEIESGGKYQFQNFNKCKITFTENDLIFPNEALPIEVARGCSFNCPFCSFSKKKVGVNSVKDPHILKDELQYNYDHFGTTKYMVMDPTPNDSIKKLEMFCNVFKSMPFDIEWSAFGRLDVFKKYPQMREIFLEGGAKAVQFGIESLHDPTMKAINKGHSSDVTKELLYYIDETWKGKIITGSFFIAGLPEESEEEFYRNMEWVLEDDCPLFSIDVSYLSIRTYQEQYYKDLDFSKFSKNSSTFNYTGPNKNWYNEKTKMDRDRALFIASDVSSKSKSKRRINYHLYTRMLNLGYTFDELYNMPKDYSKTFVEANMRKRELFKTYMERLEKI